MKRWYGLVAAGGFMAIALVSGAAYAARFGGRCGMHGMLVPPIVAQMVSHDKLHGIFEANKTDLKNLHQQVRTARQQLETDLIAGKDTSKDVQALETARNNMLAERIKLAQQVMASLSPDQRAKVADFETKERGLREQHMQLFKQYWRGDKATQQDE